jgi:hypothetical protein
MPRLTFNGFRFELRDVKGDDASAKLLGLHWSIRDRVAWTGSYRVAAKLKQYADFSAIQKLREEEARRQRDIEEWPVRHRELLNKFLEITDSKVSVLDDYGDENWDALPGEIERLLLKTAKADNDNLGLIRKLLFKRLGAEEINQAVDKINFIDLVHQGTDRDKLDMLAKKYVFLESDLEARLRAYHADRKRDTVVDDLGSLTGVEFETYLARVLKEHGLDDIRATAATGDQGADLIARLNGRSIVIQAKRYRGSVGNRAVQEAAGAVGYYQADEAWVITSGTFTASAKALAQANNVKLIDGYALRNRRFPLG